MDKVPAVLARAQQTCGGALRRAVQKLPAEIILPVSYHLGWSDAEGNPASSSGGKGIRSALCLLSAEAVGVEAAVAVPAATAVELVHNFSLLHDDVIDDDRQRRHRPTVWSLWGIGQAVIAGDALLSLAHEVLIEAPSPYAFDAARRLARATSAMIAGQAQDMAAEGCHSVSLEACEATEKAKTAELLAAAASLGAVLAGAEASWVETLERYGTELGMAFQATDDILGIWGDSAVTGKPAWSDLRRSKATLPIAAALANGGGAAQELEALLVGGMETEDQLARAAALIEETGGRAHAERVANQSLQNAIDALWSAPLQPGPVKEMIEVANFVLDRDF